MIMANQNTLQRIMETMTRSKENIVLVVNMNYRALQKRHALVVKKSVYKKTKRVSEAMIVAESAEEGSSAMDMDGDVSDDDVSG
ncbi:hypothetical protein V491_03742 [Pseudogymnoascus sp. VKM F-3775]|nr:hypothetical protein V491_03742 [Pseudogymnoascus sp. VKM F-3775]